MEYTLDWSESNVFLVIAFLCVVTVAVIISVLLHYAVFSVAYASVTYFTMSAAYYVVGCHSDELCVVVATSP